MVQLWEGIIYFICQYHRFPDYEYPTDSVPNYLSILVPNVDNARTDFLINTISKQNKSVLLIGEQVTSLHDIQTHYLAYNQCLCLLS